MTEPAPVEVLDPEPVRDLERYEPASVSLFLTSDPDTFLARASEAATALARVIRERRLYTTIRGRDHVHVEGWTLLGSLLGVFPVTEWTRPLDDGWEARVVARTRAGELVGAAESMCLRTESKWRTADAYAVRSMAATRATSKALRLPLGFVMELVRRDAGRRDAGRRGPCASAVARGASPSEGGGVLPPDVRPTKEQVAELNALLRSLDMADPGTDWPARCSEIVGQSGPKTTKTQMAMLIEKLQGELKALADDEAGGDG